MVLSIQTCVCVSPQLLRASQSRKPVCGLGMHGAPSEPREAIASRLCAVRPSGTAALTSSSEGRQPPFSGWAGVGNIKQGVTAGGKREISDLPGEQQWPKPAGSIERTASSSAYCGIHHCHLHCKLWARSEHVAGKTGGVRSSFSPAVYTKE